MVDNDGKVKAVGLRLYCDCGYRINEQTVGSAMGFSQNCYRADSWRVVPYAVATNTPVNTYCRSPGTTQVSKRTQSCIVYVLPRGHILLNINGSWATRSTFGL